VIVLVLISQSLPTHLLPDAPAVVTFAHEVYKHLLFLLYLSNRCTIYVNSYLLLILYAKVTN